MRQRIRITGEGELIKTQNIADEKICIFFLVFIDVKSKNTFVLEIRKM